MKFSKTLASTGIAAVLYGVSLPALALGVVPLPGTGTKDVPTRVAAPEIDVSAGTKAVAALLAGMLLVGERLRSRR